MNAPKEPMFVHLVVVKINSQLSPRVSAFNFS